MGGRTAGRDMGEGGEGSGGRGDMTDWMDGKGAARAIAGIGRNERGEAAPRGAAPAAWVPGGRDRLPAEGGGGAAEIERGVEVESGSGSNGRVREVVGGWVGGWVEVWRTGWGVGRGGRIE